MNNSDQIRKAIRNLQKTSDTEIFWCEVVAVDEESETCTIKFLDTEIELDDVLLSLNKTGIINIPAVESKALVCSIDGKKINAFLLVIEKVEKYKIRFADELIFGSDSFGGMIKIEELISKLNATESKVNDILDKLINVSIPLAPSGTYPFAPIFGSITPLTETGKDDIENPKIKHGNYE